MNIEMVDLKSQYKKIKNEIDKSILNVVEETSFINGPSVSKFSQELSEYLSGAYVVPCANGTDSLQIAMMALDLEPGDEIIVPAFTYVATAEVIGLLKLVPVMVDVDPNTFNISKDEILKAITPKTKAIVPVHLFGQCADMEMIMELASENGLYVIEDNAQAIGADYYFKDGTSKKAGTIGDIGCTSFFPSKNLGCYGDGGALFTTKKSLYDKIKMIANHGQEKKYVHKIIGVNSRLDSIQASILSIKLKHLDEYSKMRLMAADFYDSRLSSISDIIIPFRSKTSNHVFHQYTLKILNGKRDKLKNYLNDKGIPSMIYYPIPLNKQEAFMNIGKTIGDLNISKELTDSVLSLPMHTELSIEQLEYITNTIHDFFKI